MKVRNLSCNSQIDYSQVPGNRILPFVFTLNLEHSNLYPEPGEHQVFCYDVEGVGQENANYANLSHFLLGICSSITREDIRSISVVVNGQPQTVVWGENVKIETSEHPDHTTGCAGLKFNFSLSKVDSTMQVCITMENNYPVGPVKVCVFGGNTTATGLMICGPACDCTEPEESVFYQRETVAVPVTVVPYAVPGAAKATCCGEPIVGTGSPCQGSREACSFVITQNLCIEIPISFGAVIETGEAIVQCGGVSEESCDCSGSEPESPEAAVLDNLDKFDVTDKRFFYRK